MNNFWPVRVLRFVSVFFILSVCLGMYFYPGGNIHNPAQAGYSFTHNFLSDLGGISFTFRRGEFYFRIFLQYVDVFFLGGGSSFSLYTCFISR